MAVYIRPPQGNIGLNKLCSYVKKRLLFLQFIRGKSNAEITNGIQQDKLVDGSECLIEGSVKDRISHFVLRLLCISNKDMRNFLIQSETELFMYRLEFYDIDDLKLIILDACKQSKEVLRYEFITKSLKNVLCAFTSLAQDLDIALKMNFDHIKVPFTFALNFVRDRLYPLQSGFVKVPLSELKNLLVSLFEEVITQGICQMQSSLCFHELREPRISYMMMEIKAWFKSNIILPSLICDSKKTILEENINIESLKFPPCMRNLHLLLRKSHRLQHNARIQYTLFLKEIGVSYQEVISLFSKEYSTPISKTCSNKCDHSWDDSKNRYIYSIEHLYGKRGSGKNYRAHSCFSLQSCDSHSSYDGGCPFSGFDSNNIENMLSSDDITVTDIEDIKMLSEKKQFTKACCCYLSKKVPSSKESLLATKSVEDNCSKHIPSSSAIAMDTCLHKTELKLNCANIESRTENNFQKYTNSSKLESVLSRPSDFYFILSSFSDKS